MRRAEDLTHPQINPKGIRMSDSISTPLPETDKTATVTLATPILRESGPIDQLTLRKPKAGELRGLSLQALMQSDINALITVLPRISTPFVAEHEAANLEADDLAEIGGAILGFFMSPAQKAQIQQLTGTAAPTT